MSGCLLAGIGGTKARFAMFHDTRLGAVETLATSDYTHAIDGIHYFLARHPRESIDRGVIAAAGPVQNGRCALTNASWVLDGEELRKTLQLRTVRS